MCGIVAVINKNLPVTIKDFIVDAMQVGHVRGNDSTGMVVVNTKGEVSTYKRSLAGPDFVQLKTAERLFTDTITAPFFIGHHRAATRGVVSDVNAHPFSYNGIHLVHNGTIYNQHELCTTSTVDSEAITKAMVERGEKETLESIRGAFALVWYNENDKTFNFARNNERPLWMVEEQDDKGVLLASEYMMLYWLAERNKIKVKDKALPVDTLIHIKVPLDFSKKFEMFKFKENVLPPIVNHSQNYENYYRGSYSHAIPTKVGDTFEAFYRGKIDVWSASKSGYVAFHHFQRKGEAQNNYIAPCNAHIKYKAGVVYRVKAEESRYSTNDISNKLVRVLNKVRPQKSAILDATKEGDKSNVSGGNYQKDMAEIQSIYAVNDVINVRFFAKQPDTLDPSRCTLLGYVVGDNSTRVKANGLLMNAHDLTKIDFYECQVAGYTTQKSANGLTLPFILVREIVPIAKAGRAVYPLFFKDSSGVTITRAEFAKKTAQGCYMCKEKLDIDKDGERIQWLDGVDYLCPDCSVC